jgi:hypothetical protein
MLSNRFLYPGLPRFIFRKTIFHTLSLPFRDFFIRVYVSIDRPAVPGPISFVTTEAPALRNRW